jgi:hypothetical protein
LKLKRRKKRESVSFLERFARERSGSSDQKQRRAGFLEVLTFNSLTD